VSSEAATSENTDAQLGFGKEGYKVVKGNWRATVLVLMPLPGDGWAR